MSKDIKSKYTYVTDEENKWTAIAIKEGKFSGVIYRYGKVTISEEENTAGHLPFRFEYDILDSYGLERSAFDKEFFTLIGDILVDVIDEQLENNNLAYKSDN